MSRYIKLVDALRVLADTCYLDEIDENMQKLPSIDIEPKRGEWVDDGGIEKCNQCGERKEFPHWNFCPNCGADMKGADDE